ncbi:hypothetical protein GLOIN_2v1868421 [Rhizophagus clarus]|uniref:TLDc domain-containing protein n=1 Tax=Rhizophagus clarus TaxID=94130 RepID=A0A8H3QW44_9GLOM|nr:hypothetical protein GLOIN_2v1868421 [Rhizophagus clarus]
MKQIYKYMKTLVDFILSLDEIDIFKVLATADELNLQELVDYIQKYLIENKSEWLEQHFEFTQQISSRSNNLSKLQEFYTTLWGLAQNPTLIPDPKSWSKDDFKMMRNTLQHCLPLVRFFCLSSKEFSQKVRPYRKLVNQQLYDNLLNFYLEPDSVSSHNIQRPRNIMINEIIDEVIDSLIVDSGIVLTISRWIDKVDINDNNFKESYLPYKLELLLRGSRDGFTPKKFHELCDNKPNTVIFIKIKGAEEIVGGYNPLKWNSSNTWDYALSNHYSCGPKFGHDIVIYNASNETSDYDVVYCEKHFYEKQIRDSDDKFIIEDYEVFLIIKK